MQRILKRAWITLCVAWFFIAIPIGMFHYHGVSGLWWLVTHYTASLLGPWIPIFWRLERLWPLLLLFTLILLFWTIPSLLHNLWSNRARA